MELLKLSIRPAVRYFQQLSLNMFMANFLNRALPPATAFVLCLDYRVAREWIYVPKTMTFGRSRRSLHVVSCELQVDKSSGQPDRCARSSSQARAILIDRAPLRRPEVRAHTRLRSAGSYQPLRGSRHLARPPQLKHWTS